MPDQVAAPSPPRPHRSWAPLPEWEGYQRRIDTRAAYEQRHDEPGRDYGIAGVEIHFALIKRQEIAVEWELLTAHYLPHVRQRHRKQHVSWGLGPTPGPVRFHWREKPEWWEGDAADECYLIGGPCYTDVGFTVGDDVYAAWAYGGLDGVFGKLRELLEGNDA